MQIKPGCCVKLPDGRIGRVRDKNKYGMWRVRVKRKHQIHILFYILIPKN